MSNTTTTEVTPLNGVPVDKLRGTIAKLTENPELANFAFAAKNTWITGTATASTMHDWHGAGADHVHADVFTAAADHPTLGNGLGPTPHEYVLHALASCVAAGIATTAANRGITLTRIDSVARGTMDVQGILGIDPEVRNGFNGIEVEVELEGDAPREELDALIAASTKRSAVFDIITAPTPAVVRPAA